MKNYYQVDVRENIVAFINFIAYNGCCNLYSNKREIGENPVQSPLL